MASKLAATTFATGPTDDVAVVDVYETTTAEPQNALPKSNLQNVTESVSAAASTLKDTISEKTSTIKEGLKGVLWEARFAARKDEFPDKLKAADKLKETLKGMNLDDIKGKVLDDLMESVGYTGDPTAFALSTLGLPNQTEAINKVLEDNPKLKILYDGVSTVHQNADLSTGKGIAKALNTLAGDSELAKALDMESTFNTLSKLTSAAHKYFQINGVIAKALGWLENDDEKRKFCIKIGPEAFQLCNIPAINALLDYLGSDGVLAKYPNCIPIMLRAYRLPVDAKVPTMAHYNELSAVLNRINPRWDEYLRGSTWVSNLEAFEGASRQALEVLSLVPTYRLAITIANSYPRQSLQTIARRNFPRAPL